MKIYLFDENTNLLTGVSKAAPGDVPDSWIFPHNATPEAPPEIPGGKTARWNGSAWELADLPAPEELRRKAYEYEADGIRNEAIGYRLEADAWRAAGDGEKADAAAAKAVERIAAWLAIREEIRKRHPSPASAPDPGQADTGLASAAGIPPDTGDDGGYVLSTGGVYHRGSCPRRPGAGDPMPLESIALANPEARACNVCKPPSFQKGSA